MKELEDYPWFPDALRLQQMEFIGWTTSHMGVLNGAVTPYRIWKPEGKIMDLCSGSGQPAIWMHPKSGSGYLELTDLHPSFLKTFPEGYASANVVLRTQPLDVLGTERRWMNEASGFTMYNAFHHFSAHQQKMIVSQLIQAEKPFFFVEILQPNLWSFLQILLTTTLGQFILGPFIRPFRWSRLLFTYLLPVNLLTITFDGLVSVFRSQSKEEYQRRISSLATEEYEIKIYNKQSAFGTQLTIIEGVPIQQDL
jgi:hypothetical protein